MPPHHLKEVGFRNLSEFMKKIILNFYWYRQLIVVPDFVEAKVFKYQKDFFKWIESKNNKHGYWEKLDDGDLALNYDGSAFVEWLNDTVLSDGDKKAEMIDKDYRGSIDIVTINF